jgi:hypothetical protein
MKLFRSARKKAKRAGNRVWDSLPAITLANIEWEVLPFAAGFVLQALIDETIAGWWSVGLAAVCAMPIAIKNELKRRESKKVTERLNSLWRDVQEIKEADLSVLIKIGEFWRRSSEVCDEYKKTPYKKGDAKYYIPAAIISGLMNASNVAIAQTYEQVYCGQTDANFAINDPYLRTSYATLLGIGFVLFTAHNIREYQREWIHPAYKILKLFAENYKEVLSKVEAEDSDACAEFNGFRDNTGSVLTDWLDWIKGEKEKTRSELPSAGAAIERKKQALEVFSEMMKRESLQVPGQEDDLEAAQPLLSVQRK